MALQASRVHDTLTRLGFAPAKAQTALGDCNQNCLKGGTGSESGVPRTEDLDDLKGKAVAHRGFMGPSVYSFGGWEQDENAILARVIVVRPSPRADRYIVYAQAVRRSSFCDFLQDLELALESRANSAKIVAKTASGIDDDCDSSDLPDVEDVIGSGPVNAVKFHGDISEARLQALVASHLLRGELSQGGRAHRSLPTMPRALWLLVADMLEPTAIRAVLATCRICRTWRQDRVLRQALAARAAST
mmetsp:Transcript_9827/g.19319  ORF Transcript_9827/g.19319 Transcript_9827/m.19319 type:complete len:246 (+) Transcript_9827:23-760(+)